MPNLKRKALWLYMEHALLMAMVLGGWLLRGSFALVGHGQALEIFFPVDWVELSLRQQERHAESAFPSAPPKTPNFLVVLSLRYSALAPDPMLLLNAVTWGICPVWCFPLGILG